MSLQAELEEREQARILAKRERMAQLAERFQDSKRRTMGLDVEALDQQLKEKQLQEQHTLQEELDDVERERAIARYLDQQEAKEAQERRHFVQDLASEWHSMTEEKQKREMEEKEEDKKLARDLLSSDTSHVGKSALLNFSGEDFFHEERERMKKQQMNQWIREQMRERNQFQQKEKEEDEQQASFMQSVVHVRERLDREDQERHRQFLLQVKEENKKLAEERQEREDKQRERDDMLARQEIEQNIHSPMLSEERISTFSPHFSRDAFRGFSQAQVRSIFKENQRQEEARRRKEEIDREEDEQFQDTMGSVNRYLDWQDRQERNEKERLKQEYLEGLRQQMEEQKQRKEKEREEKFGTVNEDFFNAFGKSAR